MNKQLFDAKEYLRKLTAMCEIANIVPSAMGDKMTESNGIIWNDTQVNKPGTYVIDSLPANNLPIEYEH